MATFLYRLGRLAFRRRWYVALVWAAVLAAVGLGALKAPGAADEGFSMPGIESQKAFDLMEERFPGATADSASARVVFVAPDGEKVTAADNKKAVEEAVAELGDGSQVASVVDPFRAKAVSRDGTTAYATVTYKVASNDLTDAGRSHLERALDDARDSGLTVEAGGSAMDDGGGAGGAAEVIGMAIAAVVLLVTFGSLAAAGLPLLTAVVGVGVSMATILVLAEALGLSTTTGTLAMMLGLAVGIDYTLFVVSRYREERAKGRTPQEAAGLAAGTAAPRSSSPGSPSSSRSPGCPSSASRCSPRWAWPRRAPSSSPCSSRSRWSPRSSVSGPTPCSRGGPAGRAVWRRAPPATAAPAGRGSCCAGPYRCCCSAWWASARSPYR